MAKRILTDDEVLIGQCVTFFSAGFDTVATTMAVAAHFLAVNPECQEKLFREVKAKASSCKVRQSELL
jgi:cytochrome P450